MTYFNGMILENGAGVLQGTSFPLGGNSTHSVISAHSGLPNRRLFTELNRLEHGDTFILTVLGRNWLIKLKIYKWYCQMTRLF